MHLLKVRFDSPSDCRNAFPFSVPLVRQGASIEFTAPVTLLVGENGAGKSTLLECVALVADLPAAGRFDVSRDPSLHAARLLEDHVHLTWSSRTRRGLFLRAEDYFGFVHRADRMLSEAREELRRIEREEGRGSLRAMPFARTVAELERLYGEGLDTRSHGESFLTFFQSRLAPGGLHLLDEPEAALSPTRQLALMSLIKEAVARGAQFVIATHSPMLLAYPGAALLQLDEDGARQARYDELEHVRLMRDFLAAPEAFVRHL